MPHISVIPVINCQVSDAQCEADRLAVSILVCLPTWVTRNR